MLQKAKLLAERFKAYAYILAQKDLDPKERVADFDEDLCASIEEEVVAAYRSVQKNGSDSQLVGWLGKYIRDSADTYQQTHECSSKHVVRAMSRQAPKLRDRLATAAAEIEDAIKATANQGGRKSKATGQLDAARRKLLKTLKLPPMTRDAWENAVRRCPGTLGAQRWKKRHPPARARDRRPAKAAASRKAVP